MRRLYKVETAKSLCNILITAKLGIFFAVYPVNWINNCKID